MGKWSFDHVFVGQAAEFESWKAGQRTGTFAPVMLQFDDTTSPMVPSEIGEAHSVTARVLPTSYSVNDAEIRFEGRSPELGLVQFSGRLDQGALATARRNLAEGRRRPRSGGAHALVDGRLTASLRSEIRAGVERLPTRPISL